MRNRTPTLILSAFLGLAIVGCADPSSEETPPKPSPSSPASKPAANPASESTVIPYPDKDSKTLALEIMPDKRRRVLVETEVCLREGPIELLLCKTHTKEHEAILRADLDARHLKALLLLAELKEGKPAEFDPKFKPPTGDPIAITVRYTLKGKTVEMSAREWVKNPKTKKVLESDWVFAGSKLFEDLDDKTRPKFFAANAGDLITVTNFDTALLDVPFESSKNDAERWFEANSDKIPAKETKVTLILEKGTSAQK